MPTLDFVQTTPLASSITHDGKRLDSLLLRYPRMVHADFMTHRVFSRNASSSRAIPLKKMLLDAPYVPLFRENQPGMQPGEYLSNADQKAAEAIWLEMADAVRAGVAKLGLPRAEGGLNIHKQWVNRATEFFGYISVVVSATDWINFLTLRDDAGAQDEIQVLARRIKADLEAQTPRLLGPNEWHLPFVDLEADLDDVLRMMRDQSDLFMALAGQVDFAFKNLPNLPLVERLLIVSSAARCARASYRDFDGSKAAIERDVGTFLKLAGSQPVHASPLEHQARPAGLNSQFQGNFRGFQQFRKFVPGEAVWDA
ncbi:putative thymidylate synthase [Caulobacter phage CcrBL10]|uniref:Putative thymidylate synthase n=1 Tax=Caulobacter phage CcrBL10 TaxID=2283269 RepID=A0A385E8Y5_9CAUD|nr:putative thymidylate synthase [Caulobacter phage CcrBL10]AXQ68311.1 putative thymidylate synthase [Caulobacter phage CcrBL10]